MTRALVLFAFVAAGCVDSGKCMQPTEWKPCVGEMAEPGASGTPPAIIDLSVPTCAYADNPVVTGTMHVTDPDSDALDLKVTFSAGMRLDDSESVLPDDGRMGTEWIGTITLRSESMMAMESTDDVRVKVTDAQGGQSLPWCGSLTFLK